MVFAGIILTIITMGLIQNVGYATNESVTPSPNSPQKNLVTSDSTNNNNSTGSSNPTPTNNIPTSFQHSDGIKVYGKDSSIELEGIDWGRIFIDITNYYYISITNVGDQPVILELSVTNWTPGVNGVVYWNYNGATIPINGTVAITLSLIIKDATTDTFSNDITITSKST